MKHCLSKDRRHSVQRFYDRQNFAFYRPGMTECPSFFYYFAFYFTRSTSVFLSFVSLPKDKNLQNGLHNNVMVPLSILADQHEKKNEERTGTVYQAAGEVSSNNYFSPLFDRRYEV